MELFTLASGSKGNSTFVGSEMTNILVDIGLSTKMVTSILSENCKKVENLSALFITHEHRDHILGLKTFLKKYKFPVFATASTIDQIIRILDLKDSEKILFQIVGNDESFELGDMKVKTFSIPHDAADPIGFSFRSSEKKVSVCTDIGMITDCIKENIKGSNALVLEANHDEHILQAGRYPYHLKKRILSDIGHLSNENSGRLLANIWHEDLKQVFLGHLSAENNLPEIALMSVKYELLEKHSEFELYTKITVAKQNQASERCII